MGELRRLEICGAEDQDVFEGVGQVVLTAYDVADAEVDVIGAGSQVIGWRAIAAEKREVFDIGGGFRLLAVDMVCKADVFGCIARNAESQNELLAGCGA